MDLDERKGMSKSGWAWVGDKFCDHPCYHPIQSCSSEPPLVDIRDRQFQKIETENRIGADFFLNFHGTGTAFCHVILNAIIFY